MKQRNVETPKRERQIYNCHEPQVSIGKYFSTPHQIKGGRKRVVKDILTGSLPSFSRLVLLLSWFSRSFFFARPKLPRGWNRQTYFNFFYLLFFTRMINLLSSIFLLTSLSKFLSFQFSSEAVV